MSNPAFPRTVVQAVSREWSVMIWDTKEGVCYDVLDQEGNRVELSDEISNQLGLVLQQLGKSVEKQVHSLKPRDCPVCQQPIRRGVVEVVH